MTWWHKSHRAPVPRPAQALFALRGAPPGLDDRELNFIGWTITPPQQASELLHSQREVMQADDSHTTYASLSEFHHERKRRECPTSRARRARISLQPVTPFLYERRVFFTPVDDSSRWWAVSLGRLRARAEEEFLHFAFEEATRLRLDRRQPVFVDEHRLMLHPPSPRFL